MRYAQADGYDEIIKVLLFWLLSAEKRKGLNNARFYKYAISLL